MIDILCLGLMILVAASSGKKILRLSGFKFNTLLEEFIFQSALGLGVLAYIILGFGLWGWLYTWAIFTLLVLLGLISVREIKSILSGSYKKIIFFVKGKARISKLNFITLGLVFILSIHIILNLLSCLAPPSAVDPLALHLALPKIYIQNHRIGYIPYPWHSNFPFTINMLYLAGMLLWSDRLPALIHFFFGILVLVAIVSFCRQNFKRRFSFLAGALFYSLVLVTFESTSAFIDLGLTAFVFLAVYAFFRWQDIRERKWLILSGIFAGLAAGTKHLGLIHVLLITIMSGIRALFLEKGKLKDEIPDMVRFCVVSALVALPWYLKSWVFTGNPVFPFFFKFFGGRDWNIYSSKMISESLFHYGIGYSLKSFLLAPWNVTIHGDAFELGWAVGPLFLSFLPFVILFWKDTRMLRDVSIYSLLCFPFWFFLSQQGRFLLPMTPFLSILTAYIIFRLFELNNAIRHVVFAVVSASFLFNCGVNIIFNAQFLPVVFGFESEEHFLSKKAMCYNEFMYVNRNLPLTSKILVWTRGRYYLDRDYIPAHPAEQGLINYTKYNTAFELLLRLKELGVTHIIKPKKTSLEDIQNSPWEEKDLYRLQYEMEKTYLKPIYKNRSPFVRHRTLLRDSEDVDVFIYEINYPL